MKDQIIYVSHGARIFIAAVVAFVFLCSISLVTYLLLQNPNGVENIVSAGISLAQTSATAVGFLVVLFFSRFSANLSDLREKSDRFFMEDIPASFATIDYEMEEPSSLPSPDLRARGRAKVLTGFVRGTNLARYRVEALGKVQKMGIMMNINRVVVTYEFEPGLRFRDEDVLAVFEHATGGAAESGYTISWRLMGEDHYGQARVELRAARNLDDEFLLNPVQKLFICNDIAIMTRAVIACTKAADELEPANDVAAEGVA